MRIWSEMQEGLGAFGSTTKSELVVIPDKAKIDAVTYVETVMTPYLVLQS